MPIKDQLTMRLSSTNLLVGSAFSFNICNSCILCAWCLPSKLWSSTPYRASTSKHSHLSPQSEPRLWTVLLRQHKWGVSTLALLDNPWLSKSADCDWNWSLYPQWLERLRDSVMPFVCVECSMRWYITWTVLVLGRCPKGAWVMTLEIALIPSDSLDPIFIHIIHT